MLSHDCVVTLYSAKVEYNAFDKAAVDKTSANKPAANNVALVTKKVMPFKQASGAVVATPAAEKVMPFKQASAAVVATPNTASPMGVSLLQAKLEAH